MKPLAIDLFCGLGGFTEGMLAEGYDCVGFDIERHDYGTGGYPAQLVLQDVLTLHGRQFRDASLIVASPPCQFFSYCAMPWSRAKQLARDVRADPERTRQATALFDACFRIQREAIESAGHHIPLVVENVRGAQPWVGRARWAYGSFMLWGDVPALMPMTKRLAKAAGHSMNKGDPKWNMHHKECVESALKVPGFRFDGNGGSFQTASVGVKNQGTTCFSSQETRAQTGLDGVKQHKSGRAWFADQDTISGSTASGSSARKAASAAIAKIPFPLARHIAQVYKPQASA